MKATPKLNGQPLFYRGRDLIFYEALSNIASECIFHQNMPLEAEEREGQLHREIQTPYVWWVTVMRARL